MSATLASDAAAAGQARPVGDRSGLAAIVLAALAALLIAAALLSVAAGPSGFMPGRALAALTGAAGGERDALIINEIRLPRTLFALLAGAALATSGCVMQSLFRNPLADPGLIGVSSGAAVAVVVIIVVGGPAVAMLPEAMRALALPAAAFAGALASTLTLYAIATRTGRTSIATMLLAGIAIAALTGAVTGLMIFRSDDRQLRDLTFWSLGSLGGASWPKLAMIAPFVAVSLAGFAAIARDLDGLLLGESEAAYLGVRVEAVKRMAIVAVAAGVGATVAFTGVIGFIGIVVPHLMRLAIGPLHRPLLPASALGGAILLTLADTACRVVVAPAELPIGILTALFGAPFFLWLLLRRRGTLDL